MQEIITTAIQTTFSQLIGLIGVFFLFGYLLSVIQKGVLRVYRKNLGWKSILFTAWIGTPIHELAHLFFGLLFNYKIKEVSLFHPNKKTGRLGHVTYGHTNSIFQRIGKFFVGSAPLIVGSGVLILLLYLLVPNGRAIYQSLFAQVDQNIYQQIKNILTGLFSKNNLISWQFWLFVYLALSVSAHISPSKRDRSQMWSGAVWLAVLTLTINFLNLTIFDFDINRYVARIDAAVALLTATFIFSTVVSVLHLLLVKITFPLLFKK